MPNVFRFENAKPREFPGGTFRRASQKNFEVLRGLAIQSLHLKPGVIREPHVHPNANQLDYCVSGKAQVGIIGPEGHKQLLDLTAGDISFVPQGQLHWIQNTGKTPLHFLVVLSHEEPETIELSEMIRGVPKSAFSAMYGLPEDVLDLIPEKTVTIGAGQRL
jgi:oxalate decarboxylase/phosphoglucose isomerase-like protein (cupin superfamily)